jgi:hypothetical protein
MWLAVSGCLSSQRRSFSKSADVSRAMSDAGTDGRDARKAASDAGAGGVGSVGGAVVLDLRRKNCFAMAAVCETGHIPSVWMKCGEKEKE